ncbi:sialate O-acetylesterase [Candidatus Neomarinimicrobiota bacterium]
MEIRLKPFTFKTIRKHALLLLVSVQALWAQPDGIDTLQIVFVGGQSNVLNLRADASQLPDSRLDSSIAFYYHTGLPPGTHPEPFIATSDSNWTFLKPQIQVPFIAYSEHFFGPEMTLARTLAENGMDNLAVFKVGYGGTDLAHDWKKGDDSAAELYALLVDQLAIATDSLRIWGIPWKFIGMAWMQGESDAIDSQWAADYAVNLTQFIADVRGDFNAPTMPVVLGQIANTGAYPYSQEVRAAQVEAAAVDSRVELVLLDDLPLDPDGVHFTTPAVITMGQRMGQSLLELFPDTVTTIEYFCSIDSSFQKALYYAPFTAAPTPLLVALHTWSGDYSQGSSSHYSDFCIENGWAFIHPDFRGDNDHPDALGSEKAIQDIVDAVTYAISMTNIDTNRIYLVGASGGGHAALQVAAKGPSIWAGISAWVPITDIVAWYSETRSMDKDYWQDITNACGGNPTSDSAAYQEAWQRSPINFLTNARGLNIDINAGIHDGHGGYAVPISHSLYAFNELAAALDTLSSEEIQYFVSQEAVPPDLQNEYELDPLYGERAVLFRRSSNQTRITIFEGIHEIIYDAACEWLAQQRLVALARTDEGFQTDLPRSFHLDQNYPNPFNPVTTLYFETPSASYVQLVVYDLRGRVVSRLVDTRLEAGFHHITWDARMVGGREAPAGIYIARFSTPKYSRSIKMVLMK